MKVHIYFKLLLDSARPSYQCISLAFESQDGKGLQLQEQKLG